MKTYKLIDSGENTGEQGKLYLLVENVNFNNCDSYQFELYNNDNNIFKFIGNYKNMEDIKEAIDLVESGEKAYLINQANKTRKG